MGLLSIDSQLDFKTFQRLKINGELLEGVDIISYCQKQKFEIFNEIAIFMKDWLNNDPEIEVQTSGSTGRPQKMKVLKSQMLQSAAATALFFDFKNNENIYLSLSIRFIAGKMMIVRALYSQMNLIVLQEQNNRPIEVFPDDLEIHFAAFVPLQLKGAIASQKIKTILLGGASISTQQEEYFQSLTANIYHSYGMTETLSHVAIRKVNGLDRTNIFTALPGIQFELDDRNCLIIDVPFLPQKVITNDIVELIDSNHFLWKGRFDNIINSGGIKIFPEELEIKIQPLLNCNYFFIGLEDEILGEKVCLFIESLEYSDIQLSTFKSEISQILSKYEMPKEIYFKKNFSYTLSSKIKRKDTVIQYFEEK